MKQVQWVIVGILVLLVVFGGVYYFAKSAYKTPNATASMTTELNGQKEQATASSSDQVTTSGATVKITSSGFSPETVKIKVGDKVIFVNEDGKDHQVASATHPVHTDYPKLNVGVLKSGEMGTALFDKTGTFGYHDHLNPTMRGEVVVE